MTQGSNLYRRALREATAHHAASKTYSGKLLRPHKPYLSAMIDDLEITSAIDIGCGKCEQYRWVDPLDGKTMEQAWGFEVAKYDPACPPYNAEPQGEFDLVICTHTLGSIPLVDLDWFVDGLLDRATKAVFIAEKIGGIKKSVHGEREGFINEWNNDDWIALIESRKYAKPISDNRHSDVQVHLSTVELIHGEKITQRTVIV